MRLSRYKMPGDKIQLNTEQQIIDVPVDRGICCHVGGHIDFDSQGNLFLSTGDDTNPFESQGYSPIDDSAGRNPAFDARRSAGNTNDLRGKVLRIKPKAGGGYEIPAGNLFPQGAPQTKPEIYLMGLRNPFRIAVNRENDDLYVGDYSPDANAPDPQRGPAGKGKWFVARGPGNYGWPYCATDQLPYQDWDFTTKTSSGPFNCAAPVNDSPYNTGLRQLPPTRHPDVWYCYGASAGVPGARHGRHRPDGRPGVQLQAEQQLADQVAAVLRRRAAVLRVDAGLHQGDAAGRVRQPPEDQPGPAVVHVRQPDGHRVRRGRRAVHARVRHRLLRHAAGGAARAHRLRARQPDADREGRRPIRPTARRRR